MKESYVESLVRKDLENKKAYYKNRQANLYQKSGEADYFVCIDGQAVAIETKADNGHKLTMAQLFEGYKLTLANGMFVVAFKDYTDLNLVPIDYFNLSDKAESVKSADKLSLDDYEKLEFFYKKINSKKKSISFVLGK